MEDTEKEIRQLWRSLDALLNRVVSLESIVKTLSELENKHQSALSLEEIDRRIYMMTVEKR